MKAYARLFIWCALPVCFVMLATGKAATPQTTFEAASIRPNNSGSRSAGLSINKGGRFTATNVTAKMLIITAYKLQEYQIIGGTSWIESDHYDIVAKSEGEANQAQVADMIKGLLADRFQLRFHHETRELPVYALLTSRSVSKLKPNTDGGTNHKSSTMRGKISAQNIPLETFVIQLSNQLDRLVVDKTGLTGNFDLELEWSPELSRAATAPEPEAPPAEGASIFTALQEQLGLRLEATKAPVDAIVIDALERPSEN